jgi:hypothetical protein
MAEVVGVSRIAIDQVFIPPEREGLYENNNLAFLLNYESEALKFATGRIIKDEDPFLKIQEQVKSKVQD